MANSIWLNDKNILKIANWLMEVLHRSLSKQMKKQNIQSKVISTFVNDLDQDTYGRGCIFVNIKDYFIERPEDLETFILILNDAIEDIHKAVTDSYKERQLIDPELVYQALIGFKQHLVEYLKDLQKNRD